VEIQNIIIPPGAQGCSSNFDNFEAPKFHHTANLIVLSELLEMMR